MTLPFERKNALLMTRDFLRSLLNRSETKRVPLEIRQLARSCLKHYPNEYEIEKLSKKCPEILGDDKKQT